MKLFATTALAIFLTSGMAFAQTDGGNSGGTDASGAASGAASGQRLTVVATLTAAATTLQAMVLANFTPTIR